MLTKFFASLSWFLKTLTNLNLAVKNGFLKWFINELNIMLENLWFHGQFLFSFVFGYESMFETKENKLETNYRFSHDIKTWTRELSVHLSFCFHEVLEELNTYICTNFQFKWLVCFVMVCLNFWNSITLFHNIVLY